MSVKLKTIILEDDFFLKTILELFCKEHPDIDYRGTFDDVGQARNFIATEPVDLILLDINLKSSNGYELLQHLPFHTRVVVTSSNSENEILANKQEGVTAFLPKPVQKDRFYRLIADLRQEA